MRKRPPLDIQLDPVEAALEQAANTTGLQHVARAAAAPSHLAEVPATAPAASTAAAPAEPSAPPAVVPAAPVLPPPSSAPSSPDAPWAQDLLTSLDRALDSVSDQDYSQAFGVTLPANVDHGEGVLSFRGPKALQAAVKIKATTHGMSMGQFGTLAYTLLLRLLNERETQGRGQSPS